MPRKMPTTQKINKGRVASPVVTVPAMGRKEVGMQRMVTPPMRNPTPVSGPRPTGTGGAGPVRSGKLKKLR